MDPFAHLLCTLIFLSLVLSKHGGFPCVVHSAVLGWDVLQALNGMGGDLRLLPDVALETFISNGVFPTKGK